MAHTIHYPMKKAVSAYMSAAVCLGWNAAGICLGSLQEEHACIQH